MQKLATAKSENSPVGAINYCDKLLKIVNVTINILRQLVLASQQYFHKMHFMIWSGCWNNRAIWGVFPDMILAAIYKVSIILKLFCYENDKSLSYSDVVIFSRIFA